MQISRRTVLACTSAWWLAACASKPAARADGTPVLRPDGTPSPPPPGTVAPELVAEQRWLEELFAGTPVLIGPGPEGSLRVEVPIKFSFDAGKKVVKPPLEAVLGKVAASLHRQKRTRVLLAAPSAEQSEALRGHMLVRGIAAYRIDRLPPRADAVELRLLMPPPAVDELKDPPRT